MHTSHLNIYSDVVYVIMKKKYTKDRFQVTFENVSYKVGDVDEILIAYFTLVCAVVVSCQNMS